MALATTHTDNKSSLKNALSQSSEQGASLLFTCPMLTAVSAATYSSRLSRSTAHVVWKLYCGSQHNQLAAVSAQQLFIPPLTILSKRPVYDSIHIHKAAKNKSTLGSAATNQQFNLKYTNMT